MTMMRRPHTLPAQKLYAAHLAPSLSRYSQDLTSRQHALEEENTELLQHVMDQRKQIANLMKGLESGVADLEACAAALQAKDVETEDLLEEDRHVDQELRMTD